MKTIKESILSSTGSGKSGFAMSYIRKHFVEPYIKQYGVDDYEKYIMDYANVDDSGKFNIKQHEFSHISPLEIEDDPCTKLPIKFGALGLSFYFKSTKITIRRRFTRFCSIIFLVL